MLGLEPSTSPKRFSGLRFAPPENDGRGVRDRNERLET